MTETTLPCAALQTRVGRSALTLAPFARAAVATGCDTPVARSA